MFILALSAKASENQKAKQHFKSDLYGELFKVYNQQMSLLVEYYNTKTPYNKLKTKKKLEELGFKVGELPKALPRAYFKNGIFEIPDINLQMNINNFLTQSISINGVDYHFNCDTQVECYQKMFEVVKPEETTFNFNPFNILKSAYGAGKISCSSDLATQWREDALLDDLKNYQSQKAGDYRDHKIIELTRDINKVKLNCKKKKFNKKNARLGQFLDGNILKFYSSILHMEMSGHAISEVSEWTPSFFPMGLNKQEATTKNINLIENKMEGLLKECNENEYYFQNRYDDDAETVDKISKDSPGLKKLLKFMTNDYMYFKPTEKNKLGKTFAKNLYISRDLDKINSDYVEKTPWSCEQSYQLGYKEPKISRPTDIQDLEGDRKWLYIKRRKALIEQRSKDVVKYDKDIAELTVKLDQYYSTTVLANHKRAEAKFCNTTKELQSCLEKFYSQDGRRRQIDGSELKKNVIEPADKAIKKYNDSRGIQN